MSQHERERDYEERFERYRRALIGFLMKFGRTRQEAEDITQTILSGVWRRAGGIARFAEWSYLQRAAYARNQNHLRNENAGVRGRSDPIPAKGVGADERDSAEQSLIEKEERTRFQQRFNALYRELPEETRIAIALHFRGKTSNEIGELLGADPTAVRSRLSRAFKRLREQLGEPPSEVTWLEIPGENE